MDGNQTPHDQPAGEGQLQPGATITPGAVISSDSPASPASAESIPQLPQVPAEAVSASSPAAQAATGPVEAPQPIPSSTISTTGPAPYQGVAEPLAPSGSQIPGQPAGASSDDFVADNYDDSIEPTEDVPGAVSWTASEFIAHSKTAEWYGVLFGGAVLIAAIVWLLTKDVFTSVVIVVAVGILGGYASRQPRELQYMVDERGITVGPKLYPFSGFRSFSIMRDAGPFSSIEFMPLKRFALPLTIHYDPTDESKIADAIAARLPYEERKSDAIDSLMRRIHF